MKVKVIEQTKDNLTVEFDSIDPYIANTIRRTIINSVPVLAIEDVSIIVNTSALYDEIIAHRLGLIPFVFDSSKIVMKSDCSCDGEGCSKCEVGMVLKKAGPCHVYAKDIKFANSSVKPVDGDILIVSLLDKQDINFEMKAEMNVAGEHAKWQSAIVGYKYDGDVDGPVKVVFNVKSISGLAPVDILVKAIDLIKLNLDMFEKAVKNPGKEDVLSPKKPSKKTIAVMKTKTAEEKKKVVKEKKE